MGEVKRYWPDGNGDAAYMIEHGSTSIADDEPDGYVRHSDYARLERKRDELVSLRDTLTAELDRRFRRIAILESSVAKCQNNDAELTRLRAVEAASPMGWAVVDRLGVVSYWTPAVDHFFGCIQANTAPDAEWIAAHDRNYAGLAPHRVVPLYAKPDALAEACGRKG